MDTAVDIGLIATPVVIFIGFLFAYKQWRATRNARMAGIVMSITAQWDSPGMKESRRAVNALNYKLKEEIYEADRKNLPELYTLLEVANFFDALGLLIVEGLLSRRLGYRLFGRAEERYYELYRPVIEQGEFSGYLKCFPKLHDAFKREAAKRPPRGAPHAD